VHYIRPITRGIYAPSVKILTTNCPIPEVQLLPAKTSRPASVMPGLAGRAKTATRRFQRLGRDAPGRCLTASACACSLPAMRRDVTQDVFLARLRASTVIAAAFFRAWLLRIAAKTLAPTNFAAGCRPAVRSDDHNRRWSAHRLADESNRPKTAFFARAQTATSRAASWRSARPARRIVLCDVQGLSYRGSLRGAAYLPWQLSSRVSAAPRPSARPAPEAAGTFAPFISSYS